MGEITKESDLDILVEFKREKSLLNLKIELEETLNGTLHQRIFLV